MAPPQGFSGSPGMPQQQGYGFDGGGGLAVLRRPYPEEGVTKLQAILALIFGLHIFMIIVPAIKLWVYSILAWIFNIIAWFQLLFGGGRYPAERRAWMVKFLRYQMRFISFARCVTSVKPGDFDDDNHPIDVHVPPTEKISILQLFLAPFLILPQLIVGYFYIMFYGGIMNLIAIFQVIGGGKPGEGQFAIIQKCDQQMLRLMAYTMWLTDQKPPIVPGD
jgi:hypothetical protein